MKIQNMIKKITIAVLSAAMMLAPIVNIKAASTDVVDTSKTGSITIHKYDMTAAKQAGVNTSQFTPTGKQDAAAEAALEKYAIKGVEFSYLRVGDVEQQSENGKIQMIYELPTTIQQILGLTSSDAAKTEGSKTYFTSQQINEKLAKALEDNTVTKDKLEDYMGKNGTAMDETNANGVTSKDKLPLGLYLIVETKAPENVTYTTNPWFVQLPSTDSKGDDWFYDVICYPKNETGNPTLDKRVRNNPDQDNVTTANTDRLADFTSARNEYKYQSTVTASKAERLDYQITSKISYGKETMVFQGAYDISEVYATRHQQLVSFRKIFVLVIGIEIVVSYFLAMILTRPLQKLSQVSKQIADGDYSVRVPVHTEDEIGELSVSFNYMTEQLIEKLMKLDQLLKNQEEFMGSFAHEMKTPLTSIIGYADLMRMEALSKEEQKEACGYIYSEGKRLQNLSLKLMKLLVLKNQQFQMKKQDLEPMIQEAVTSMQYRLKEQDILVNLNLKKAICKIEPDLLKSLILNLIDNALKSMNSGGILTVEDRATQEGAKIYISDTGCGMPKDEISKITEAFYRIDKSRSRKQGGVGLGLAICKEIVRIHQGEMRFISQQGKGTTVIITIGGGAYEKTN